MKFKRLLYLIILVVVADLLFFVAAAGSGPKHISIDQVGHVELGGTTISVDLALTTAAREQGLSGRMSLADGTGLLFVFDHPDIYSFWMKDMNFPIDMIWFDQNMNVVYVVKNASPDSYPTAFTPSENALYVLEVPAGFSDTHGIDLGSKAQFTL